MKTATRKRSSGKTKLAEHNTASPSIAKQPAKATLSPSSKAGRVLAGRSKPEKATPAAESIASSVLSDSKQSIGGKTTRVRKIKTVPDGSNKNGGGKTEFGSTHVRVPAVPNKASGGNVRLASTGDKDPAGSNNGNGGSGNQSEGDSNHFDPHSVAALRELQCQRVIMLRASQRLSNQAKAYIRRMLGWHGGLSEKESTAISSKAGEIVKQIESGASAAIPFANGKTDSEPLAPASLLVLKLYQARTPIDNAVDHIEKSMIQHAKKLPIAEWVENQLGLGLKGLAIIVGEAGDIGKYSIRGLRKYMALAPFEGKACSTWRMSKPGLSAEQWTAAGYCPRRMAVMYQLAESAGVKCTRSEYRKIYDETRLIEATKTDKKIIAHRRAMRKVASRILIDLQLEWAKQTGIPLPSRRH